MKPPFAFDRDHVGVVTIADQGYGSLNELESVQSLLDDAKTFIRWHHRKMQDQYEAAYRMSAS